MADKIIMGIDPGTSIMGYSIISTNKKNIRIITNGVLRLQKIEGHFEKLKVIFDRLAALVKEYRPADMAIEAPFYGKNAQSMLKLGRAQGAAISMGLHHGLSVFEYSPKRIKQSITGNGNASKEQVALMLQQQLHIAQLPKYLDETDALAAAVCHYYQASPGNPKKGQFKSWQAFIAANPNRLK